jgi:hypothetical protein
MPSVLSYRSGDVACQVCYPRCKGVAEGSIAELGHAPACDSCKKTHEQYLREESEAA